MRVSDEALDEFIKIYKKEFKEKISREEAREMASRLLTLYQLLSQKPPNGSASDGEREERKEDSHQDDEPRASSPVL
jgi:hypothetical protein